MAAWFAWAPDLRVDVCPLRLAKDSLTAVTGQAFALDMVTVGIWNRQGAMDEEFFFRDNQAFYTKMSLG